jgi:hypothetical protein
MKQQILVFKTNIQHPTDIMHIHDVLNIEPITQWSIDTDDCDCVLRVVTAAVSSEEIIQNITNKGYLCSELTD